VTHRRRFAIGVVLASGLGAGGPTARAAGDCADVAPPPTADPSVDRKCVSVPPPGVKLAADLDVLKTPDTPAAAALGLTATDIQRPTTPTGAALAIATGVAEGLLVPGQNFAADVAPYWLWAHPRLTADELQHEGFWGGLLHTTSLSIATSASKTAQNMAMPGQSADLGRLAIGARTTPVNGSPSRAAQMCAERIDRYAADLTLQRARDEAPQVAQWMKDNPPPHGDMLRKAWLKDLDAAREEIKHAWLARLPAPPQDVADCFDVRQHRVGVFVDVAGASTWSAQAWDFRQVSQTGSRDLAGWITLGYSHTTGPPTKERPTALDLSYLVLVRAHWINDYAAGQSRGTLDFGGRVVTAWNRYGVSAQYVHVQGALPDSTGVLRDSNRAGIVLDYHLQSGIWATAVVAADLSDVSKLDSWSGWRGIVSVQGNFGRVRQIPTSQLDTK
jgi:hypothetical protein